MQKIKIIHKPTVEKPYIVLYKPKNLPSAPLSSDDKNNALYQAIEIFPEIKNVQGKKSIEYGLMHRLDTPTDGLLLIATTQESYDFLQNEQAEGRFVKFYTANCSKLSPNNIMNFFEGFPVPPVFSEKSFRIESFFRPYGPGNKEVRPVTNDSGKSALNKVAKLKKYITAVKILNDNKDDVLVECSLKQGFRHQVRCHLSWIGFPIKGDELYNPLIKTELNKKNAEKQLSFSATKIQFEYPKGDLNSYEITFTWT